MLLQHRLDLLVTLHCAELEGWLTKTAQQREGEKESEKGEKQLKNKSPFRVEFGVLISEAEASGEQGSLRSEKHYLRLNMDP